jgi:hypothetical protein
LKASRSASVHQLRSAPSCVELAALVVEAVADLVADHGADGAVVHRVVGLQVEEGRLQDGGREHDLVGERVVVGVDGLRRHAPLGLVNRLAGARGLACPLETRGAQAVADRVARHHLQAAVVAPLLGVADLDQVGGELLLGAGLGLGAHPGEAVQAVAKAAQQVLDQADHALLGLGREMLGDVDATERLAQRAVDLVDALLPARLLLGGALQRRALVGEARVAEGLGQGVGVGVQQVQLEVVAPLLDGQLGQQLGGAGLRRGLAERQVLAALQPGALEEGGPVHAGRFLGQLGQGARVVELDRVAQFDLVPLRLGQLALDGQGVVGGLVGVAQPASRPSVTR